MELQGSTANQMLLRTKAQTLNQQITDFAQGNKNSGANSSSQSAQQEAAAKAAAAQKNHS